MGTRTMHCTRMLRGACRLQLQRCEPEALLPRLVLFDEGDGAGVEVVVEGAAGVEEGDAEVDVADELFPAGRALELLPHLGY